MSSPPKRKRRQARTALQIVKLPLSYRLLELVQAPFGFVFWLIKQRKGWRYGLFANQGSGRR
jgi:hypothetical protein